MLSTIAATTATTKTAAAVAATANKNANAITTTTEKQNENVKRKRENTFCADHLVLLVNEPNIICAVADMQGRRWSMEDTYINSKLDRSDGTQTLRIFAVCDGHGGSNCSIFLQQNLAKHVGAAVCGADPSDRAKMSILLKKAFADCEAEYEKENNKNAGSTCCLLVYFEKEKLFYIANCGDARAIIFDDFVTKPGHGKQITTDHKPDLQEEKQRIESLGGSVVKFVAYNGVVVHRVNGILAVARSFGDIFLRPHVTEVPDLFGPFEAKKNCAVVLACDGAFECNTTEELCEHIASVVDKPQHDTRYASGESRKLLNVVNEICGFASDRESGDNVTAICMQFV